MSFIDLPETLDEFPNLFNSTDIQKIFEASKNPASFSPTEQVVWKYSGSGILSGRPLNSAIIFMAGSSGSGKSSTVNSLFDDHHLCKTSYSRSETKMPSMVYKPIKISINDEANLLCGYLRFVDVPGPFDTVEGQDAYNVALIEKFKHAIQSLKVREFPSSIPRSVVRENVYPNIVLFVVKATDNFEGDVLRKTIELLEQYSNVIDKERPNIIVALSHCMSLGLTKESFEEKLKSATERIRRVFKLVLKIDGITVVPVENMPNASDLPKEDEFFKLPNGELSHFNLFQAMQKLLEENKDILGQLVIGHYFGAKCPEKEIRATVFAPPISLSPEELRVASLALSDANMVPNQEEKVEVYHFEKLGYGYCPVSESTKSTNLFGGNKNKIAMKIIDLHGTQFRIPSCVTAAVKRKSRFHCLSFYSKEEYQDHRKASYGIEATFNLVVKANSQGKWVSGESSSSSTSVISLAQETQLAKFTVDDPGNQITQPNFRREFDALPETYDKTTAKTFRSFFSKWGTHVIYEQSVGGILQLNCFVQTNKLTKDSLSDISGKASGFFANLVGGGSADYNSEFKNLREAGVSNEKLEIEGGVPPKRITLKTIKSEEVKTWEETVSSQPVELTHTMKLFPFYDMLDSGPKYEALREATKEYMEGKMETRIEGEKPPPPSARDKASEEAKARAELAQAGSGCFPGGTLVNANGRRQSLRIEDLHNYSRENLCTIPLKRSGGGWNIRHDGCKSTSFVSYLHYDCKSSMEYLVLEFSNETRLVVSPGHLIFQFDIEKKVAKAVQAKYFNIGDFCIFKSTHDLPFQTPFITNISRKSFSGIFCPLTSTGTFLANGFLVSSYAHTKSFILAEISLFPLKTFYWGRRSMAKHKVDSEREKKSLVLTFPSTIHPYAKFLMDLRKGFERIN